MPSLLPAQATTAVEVSDTTDDEQNYKSWLQKIEARCSEAPGWRQKNIYYLTLF
jgi:hypothetical protein